MSYMLLNKPIYVWFISNIKLHPYDDSQYLDDYVLLVYSDYCQGITNLGMLWLANQNHAYLIFLQKALF